MLDRCKQAERDTSEAWTMGFLLSLYRSKFKNFKAVRINIEEYRKRISISNENIFKVLVYEMKVEELSSSELVRFEKMIGKTLDKRDSR